MARLIDADELIYGLKIEFGQFAMKYILAFIKAQPTVDPVKHGRWIICREFDHKLKCSQCGCHTVWMDEVVPNYCPYCGARMIELKK